jgi:hypothetical protein
MRGFLSSIVVALLTGGCGAVVDAAYPGPPLARLRFAVAPSANYRSPAIGLLWIIEDPRLGKRYAVTAEQPWAYSSRLDVPVDIYSEMPGQGEFGYAFVALFDAPDNTPIEVAGSTFAWPATLVGVDTAHVLLFARSMVSALGGSVLPRHAVLDNPERLLGPGYHVAEVRCGPDGVAQQPMHVALVDAPLDRDDARPRFDLIVSDELAARSNAVAGVPLGPVGDSCLVLP